MKIKTLSATSVKTFLACESRWSAIYTGERKRTTNDAAELGTACHAALEVELAKPRNKWSLNGLHMAFVDHVNANTGTTGVPPWVEDGIEILSTWWSRQDWDDWDDREIVSLEERNEFTLDTAHGSYQFVYIIDRLDRLINGELEVVDYKSGFYRVWPDDLKYDIQARSYALAVWLAHDKPKRVWVTFDYLRSDTPQTSVAFTAEDCQEHLDFLHLMVAKILASDGVEETPNGTCRFCPRTLECDSLYKLALTDLHGLSIDQLATLKIEVANAMAGLETHKRRIDSTLREALDLAPTHEVDLPSGTRVFLGMGRRERSVEWTKLADLLALPPIPMKIRPDDLIEYIENAVLTPAQEKKLQSCIVETRGTAQVKVQKPKELS